jgi:hypothetical protein
MAFIEGARRHDGNKPPCQSPQPCREWSLCCRILPDGRVIHLVPMLINIRLIISTPRDNREGAYTEGWCYSREQVVTAMTAAATWVGVGDPPGPWIKEVMTGRKGPGWPVLAGEARGSR